MLFVLFSIIMSQMSFPGPTPAKKVCIQSKTMEESIALGVPNAEAPEQIETSQLLDLAVQEELKVYKLKNKYLFYKFI